MGKWIAGLSFFLIISFMACTENTEKLTQAEDWISSDISDSAKPSPTPTATSKPISDLYTGPAEVEKFVKKFVEDGNLQGVDLVPEMRNPRLEVRIASLDTYGGSVVGLCETSVNMRRVTFDPDFWNVADDTQKEILAHHELGHCVLYRGHRTDKLNTGVYASIMYPTIMNNSMYTNNYDYYQHELFTWSAAQAAASVGAPETTHVCTNADL